MVFRSKIDLWLIVVLAAAVIVPALRAPDAIRAGADPLAYLGLLILLASFVVWVLVSTRYTVASDAVVVRSGPFRWRIDRAGITGVTPSRSWLSSPALSLDRLRIDYAEGRKSLLISPKDQDGFLRAIGHAGTPGPSPGDTDRPA